MFGFGGVSELMFIFFLAMLIFGPEKLPEIGRMLAKGMAEVRKASNELKRTLNAELAVSEQETEARRRAEAPPIAFSPVAQEAFSPPPPAPVGDAFVPTGDPSAPAGVAPAPVGEAPAPVGDTFDRSGEAFERSGEAFDRSGDAPEPAGHGNAAAPEPLGPASDEGQELLDHRPAGVPEPLDPRSDIVPEPR